MKYFVNTFSPETAVLFDKSKREVAGFRSSMVNHIERLNIYPGDRFICYVTKIGRFIGIQEIESSYFVDKAPVFVNKNDPYQLRFKVKTLLWLPLEKAVPISNDVIWKKLSFTKDFDKLDSSWTYGLLRNPNNLWPKEDFLYLEKVLMEQSEKLIDYPFSEKDKSKIKIHQ